MLEESVLDLDPLERTEQFTEVLNDEYLKIKMNLRTILESNKYCGICLRNDMHLIYLHNETDADKYSCSMEREMHDLFCDLIYKELPSSYICSLCNTQLDQFHKFIMKTKYTSKILNSYLLQLYTQIDKAEKTFIEQKQNEYAVLTLENDISNKKEKIIKIQSKVDRMKSKKSFKPFKSAENRLKIDSYRTNSLKFTIIKGSNTKKHKYLCSHCKKVFKTRNGINYHLKTINVKQNRINVKALQCTECEIMPCEHEKYLKAIQGQIKTGKIHLRCIDCGFACFKKRSLIAHTNKVHLNKFSFLCDTCGKSFHSKSAHYMHNWEFHKDALTCKFCDKQFKNEIFDAHMKECCKITKQYQCKDCAASFDEAKELFSHEKKHKSQVYPCDKCSKSFTTLHHFKRHQNYHLTQSNIRALSKHDCSICDEKFSTLKEIKEHLKTDHRPDEKHICNDCNRIFDTRDKYRHHIRTIGHKRKTQAAISYSFACDYCTFSTNSRSRLEDHTNLHHLQIKPYNCTVCKKSFTSEKKLRLHSELHSNANKFKCQQCSSSFLSILGLKNHISRFHTKEKPYKCDFCTKTFVCLGECNVHVKRKHSNNYLCCPLCKYQVNNLLNLRNHIKTHHWKIKDKHFDITTIEGVTNEIIDLFKDGRSGNFNYL